MTFTLTAVTRNQWKKVATVALWVVLTNGIGVVTAWLTAKPELLAIGPTLNVLAKAVQQIFQTEENQAVGQLPTQLVQPTQEALQAFSAAHAPIVAEPVVFTPADKAPEPPTAPNIGSTANS